MIRVRQLKIDVSQVMEEDAVSREFALKPPAVKSFFDPGDDEPERTRMNADAFWLVPRTNVLSVTWSRRGLVFLQASTLRVLLLLLG